MTTNPQPTDPDQVELSKGVECYLAEPSLDCLNLTLEGIEFSRVAQTELLDVGIPVSGIACVASEALLAVQLNIVGFETIEANVKASVYWPDFVAAVAAGRVPDDWLPGVLGQVVMGWARRQTLEAA